MSPEILSRALGLRVPVAVPPGLDHSSSAIVAAPEPNRPSYLVVILDEEDVNRMFRPLYTTKPEGLGMGLAIARTIVDAHGGRLGAANNVQGEATFRCTVPVTREPAR